jgi:hypothetical protein
MDLTQRKLNKSEWNSVEIPVSQEEKEVLQLIIDGVHNVNIKYNKNMSLLSYLKVENTGEMEDYLFVTYFEKRIRAFEIPFIMLNNKKNPVIKKADKIRLEKTTISKVSTVYETILLNFIEKLLEFKKRANDKWLYYYFTLSKLSKNSVTSLNKYVDQFVKDVLVMYEEEIELNVIIRNSVDYIEKNEMLLKNTDSILYEHQKKIFTLLANPMFQKRQDNYRLHGEKYNDNTVTPLIPKLVFYIAPTGTGKTMTPIGLSECYRVIFMCAARHVGLALAKSAISVGKKIAFAFGCSSADDIRLHYFSAKEFKVNKKTGGIGKVDNSVGDKVEIMICDAQSYRYAMYYMKSFNPNENILTYWDEPTISMDYENHELHEIIHKNWNDNLVPTIVLSSATLPKVHEIPETVSHFISKFSKGEIHDIISHDCKKTIPVVNKNSYVVMPHLLSDDFDKMKLCVSHCKDNLTLLRYMDLNEVVRFILYVEDNIDIGARNKIERRFASLDDITMQKIKLHYIHLLGELRRDDWLKVYTELKKSQTLFIAPNNKVNEKGDPIRKSSSVGPGVYVGEPEGRPLTKMASMQENPTIPLTKITINEGIGNTAIYISTKDAYTLTDGPTIFLAEDVDKIAKFCIQQANIPQKAMSQILEKIEFNNRINDKMNELSKELETEMEKGPDKEVVEREDDGKEKRGGGGSKKSSGNKRNDARILKLNGELDMLRSCIKPAELNETFVPNKTLHLKKWYPSNDKLSSFTSDIDEETVVEIMMLKNVDNSWKVLLLMGIGVFTNHPDITYTEIMKKLADKQKLYLIIASGNYIYGTNYQFCHGYLSKDLCLTQEKLMQALGRIGRSNLQQTYSIRLRDDSQIEKLYYPEIDKPEVKNMNRLFSSTKDSAK